jgi:methanogenic corrinoid protein MtbC1
MIVTGVSGELHQIGANLVADAMESKGWDVRFLGSNVPRRAILEAVEECSAEVLCVSTTIVANLPEAADLIQSVQTQLGDRAPKVFLGGAAYRFATHFAEDFGAAGVATGLRDALALLCA